ncbi:MAG: hypothetical protein RL641_31 [Candidatus Parcubacteria bacterium]
MTAEERDRIIAILQERGARLPCSRCGNPNFSLIEGYFNHPFQPEMTNNMVIGGPMVPSVGVVCTRCGLVSFHALGALGLMPPQNTAQNEQAQS